jgi:UDP-N-acetylmuramoyl-tripeptide--D-alanyl-D-alanine ligase
MLRYLRFFQQEEYNSERYWGWLRANNAFDRRASAVLLVALAAALVGLCVWSLLGAGAALALLGLAEPDPRQAGKIKLNMTQRAKKIFGVAAAFAAFAWCAGVTAAFGFGSSVVALCVAILFVQLLPMWFIASNWVLGPFERRLQERFMAEARGIFAKHKPFVIGITGSYGKTSTKAILGQLMGATLGPTFCPPKSINTPMGITREIREKYRPEQRFAVIEMGAYNVGSIARLCRLTPPNAALVTVVGIAHLERYGSPENVYRAKSEIAVAVPDSGVLVCNGDNEGARRMAVEHPKATTVLYGMDPSKGSLDCVGKDVEMTVAGMKFTIEWKGKSYPVQSRQLGLPAVSNLLGAFTMACTLGAEPAHAAGVLAGIDPVDNRLVLSREGGVLWLRDAYNSNPAGFSSALDILRQLPGTRKILMTPGMVELGEEQAPENARVATEAARICDEVIVVGKTNRAAFVEGLKAGGISDGAVRIVDSREEAFQTLQSILKDGDAVLIENDLPDLYEQKEAF